ncbi:TRAP transporter large permease [Corynebacterium stationis]|uniref:TRAP transporter large permease n=1 Tax=Corynebacterium stationis TaxID=1705 RepID=UPI00273B178D|nr:TRAP transporter large permease [Corynebacterium stationis]WLP87275.1 TRAP transporter large permease [Corynebacterium stationis]
MTIAILIIAIAILMAIRVPVALSILGPSLVYMLATGNSPGFTMRIAADGIASFPLLAVPLFILLGTVANYSGVADRLFDFADSLFHRVTGNLGYVNVMASVGFSWMSGSALADAAAMGKTLVPAMERAGFKKSFATGLTASSSLISPVMPPSIPAVIYASVAAVSTGALFAASVLPALLLAGALLVVVAFYIARHKDELVGSADEPRPLGQATVRVFGALLTPVIILGGILGGFFTPTEAAALGALYIIILGFIYKKLTVATLWKALRETAVTTASIMLIIVAATILGWILAREEVPQALSSLMTGNLNSATAFLLVTAVLLLILGAFIEATALLLITVPILLPVATEFNVDPLHFGVVTILSLMMGLLTPPVGTVLFVLSSVLRMPVGDVFRGVTPFLVPIGVVLLLLIFFPTIVTVVPAVIGM